MYEYNQKGYQKLPFNLNSQTNPPALANPSSRGMTQLCLRHNAINLSQGTPAYQPPPEVKAAAIAAIQEGYNQYSITWGAPPFREAIAQKMTAFKRYPYTP